MPVQYLGSDGGFRNASESRRMSEPSRQFRSAQHAYLSAPLFRRLRLDLLSLDHSSPLADKRDCFMEQDRH
jgi:hypothetical protein